MDWMLSALTRSGVVGLLKAALTLLMLAGCGLLPDDEAAWVLEDLAAEENHDRLRTPVLIDALPATIRADIEALNLANQDLARLRARHHRVGGCVDYAGTALRKGRGVPQGGEDD